MDIPQIGEKTIGPAEQAVVRMLEDVLVQARQGQFNSAVLVMAGPRGFGDCMVGPDVAALFFGCHNAVRKIQDSIVAPAPAPASRIIRPVR